MGGRERDGKGGRGEGRGGGESWGEGRGKGREGVFGEAEGIWGGTFHVANCRFSSILCGDVQGTVKKTMSDFKRTHHDSWSEHKQKFTDDQLTVLADLLISPSYYA